jgi:hypothetical protein
VVASATAASKRASSSDPDASRYALSVRFRFGPAALARISSLASSLRRATST